MRWQPLDEVGHPVSGDRQEVDDQPRAEPSAERDTGGVDTVDERGQVAIRGDDGVDGRLVAVTRGGQPAEVAVEQVCGDVAHLPGTGHRRTIPVRGVEVPQERQQFGEQRPEEPGRVGRRQGSHHHAAEVRGHCGLPARCFSR